MAVGPSADYHDELRAAQLEGARLACVVGGILVPLFGILDRVVMPDLWFQFFPVRVAVTVILGLIWLSLRRPLFQPLWATAFLVLVVSAMIVYFILARDGHRSPYYAGQMLVILGVNTLVPLTLAQSLAMSGLAWGAYFVPVLVLDTVRDVPIFVNNNFFIVSTVVITAAFTAAADRARRSEHAALAAARSRAADLAAALAQIETTQRSLLQQQHLAAIGRLARTIVHHVANPMAYVTTNLGLMERDIRDAAERGVLPREYAQMIGDVVEGTQRVNEVLKALRPYARRADWTVEVVDLKSAVESAQALVAEEAAGRVQIAPDFGALPRVKGRSQEIGQVLHGLLARAVNESPADGRVLVRGEAKGDRVWVEIERDGEEIPPDERERLFEPFSAESARAGRHDLVLWTARSIAREHGGDLTLENAQGRGACFRLALPLAPPRAEPPAPPGPPAPRDA